MSYPLVRDLAAEGIPVRLTCGVLDHSRQAHYAWLAEPVSQRDLEDAYPTNALIDAHGDDPELATAFSPTSSSVPVTSWVNGGSGVSARSGSCGQ